MPLTMPPINLVPRDPLQYACIMVCVMVIAGETIEFQCRQKGFGLNPPNLFAATGIFSRFTGKIKAAICVIPAMGHRVVEEVLAIG